MKELGGGESVRGGSGLAGSGPAERVAEECAEGWGGEVVSVTEGSAEDGSAVGCQERPCDGFGFGDACGGGG